jgi:hypothetical protein
MGSWFMKKTRGRKSRETVSLTKRDLDAYLDNRTEPNRQHKYGKSKKCKRMHKKFQKFVIKVGSNVLCESRSHETIVSCISNLPSNIPTKISQWNLLVIVIAYIASQFPNTVYCPLEVLLLPCAVPELNYDGAPKSTHFYNIFKILALL